MIKKILWLSLSFSIAALSMTAQVSKELFFQQEIACADQVTIYTKGPRDFSMTMHGTMSMDDNQRAFVIEGIKGYPVLVIWRLLEVETWDKDVVRQEVTLDVTAESQTDIDRLKEVLAIRLEQKADDVIKIDCNMNIVKLRMRNGFFYGEKCWLELENGKEYPLKAVEIKTKLYVPKTANFVLNGEYADLVIKDLNGALKANLNYGSVDATNVHSVELNTLSSEIYLNEIDQARVSMRDSRFNGKAINDLIVDKGITIFSNEPTLLLAEDEFGNSSLNKFKLKDIGILNILNSENDRFVVNSIDNLNISSSIFSNYQIDKLNVSGRINCKSGDIQIKDFGDRFEYLDINNELSTIELGLDRLPNYSLTMNKDEQMNFKAPHGAVKMATNKMWKEAFEKGNGEGDIEINCTRCKLVFN